MLLTILGHMLFVCALAVAGRLAGRSLVRLERQAGIALPARVRSHPALAPVRIARPMAPHTSLARAHAPAG